MIVPPPYEVRQRAWEAAYCLRDQRLPIAEQVAVEVAYRLGPDLLGWQECQDMLAMCRQWWECGYDVAR
jgi:hypothetical protein